ncbi:hypothetical protein BGZ65_011171, partial [Modicella reniformis]
LRDTSLESQDIIKSLGDREPAVIPVIKAEELYVRKVYKDVYRKTTSLFDITDVNDMHSIRTVVTGTSGTGTSAFLVYAAIRILAESRGGPPIVVFHTGREDSRCYAFGIHEGRTTVRKGNFRDFDPFLNLPETWYLADSPDTPLLASVKTIISVSPKTLKNCKEVMKMGERTYHIPPWDLDELDRFGKFKIVDKDLMKKLYDKIGGVPRYVLQKPADTPHFNWRLLEDDPEEAKKKAEEKAYQHIQWVIHQVWNTATLEQCFDNKKNNDDHSSIFHQWPTSHDCNGFELRWASNHIQTQIYEKLGEEAWTYILKNIVFNYRSSERMFGSHVAYIFRKGGYTFKIKELGASTSGHLQIPPEPLVEFFGDAEELSRVITTENTLCIPNNPNFPCIDLALGPNKLFLATSSADHPLEQSHFENITQTILAQSDQSELHLYFVVPTKHYDGFKLQSDLSEALGEGEAICLEVRYRS